MRMFTITLLACAALTAASPVSASDETPPGKGAGTVLQLSITVQTLNAPSIPGPAPRGVTLTCDPDAGTHPTAKSACDLLRSVNGNAAALNVDPNAMCTTEYIPNTARLTGQWRGRPVSYEKIFGNRCEMIKTLGAVFAF
ncbi:SSI family serine proteinase inhibitor [Sinosporangium siamense]|uniref:SSI family serine proteinase inhibitor n=1 Tax=Sinosporangium siamense TaxID=1367973 RepID=UPI0035E9FE5C